MDDQPWVFRNREEPWPLWTLTKGIDSIRCELGRHPLGWEVRFLRRDEMYYTRVHPTREEAEVEAEQRRGELLARGWNNPRSPS
jgi:hypothetical protein